MNETPLSSQVRIGLMIATHLVLGLITASAALFWPGYNWPVWIVVPFMGLISSEILLLGFWLGLATAPWWLKLPGTVAGIGWLTALSVSPSPGRHIEDLQDVSSFLIAAVLIVAFACTCCRYGIARIQRRDSWPVRPLSQELQFTLTSLIALTIVVSAVLALGRLVHWLDTGSAQTVLVGAVISLVALLSGATLVWAGLSPGRPSVRIPTALLGMAAVGLIFPYYMGGPSWRFAVWPALTLTTSAYVLASLLVIRSCGYRLVSVWQQPR